MYIFLLPLDEEVRSPASSNRLSSTLIALDDSPNSLSRFRRYDWVLLFRKNLSRSLILVFDVINVSSIGCLLRIVDSLMDGVRYSMQSVSRYFLCHYTASPPQSQGSNEFFYKSGSYCSLNLSSKTTQCLF